MFLDPNNLNQYSPAEVLEAAAKGHLGVDHRFLRSVIDRRGSALPALVAFAERDRSGDLVDLAPEIIAIFRAWKTPEAVPFLIRYIKEDPQELPDELVETVVEIGRPALDPLLALYQELDESESGEVAFILTHLGIRDERILKILLDRLEYDLTDTALLLLIYADPAAKSALEAAMKELSDSEADVKREIADVIAGFDKPEPEAEEQDEFNIWDLYPEKEDLPVELLGEETRGELLKHPVESVRAAAAASFFNRELNLRQRKKLLQLAQQDESVNVRSRSWEALMGATEHDEVIEAMLAALRQPGMQTDERGGLLVGLASEADRNEVREAILAHYDRPQGRAKAMEAMWRSVHPSFRDKFAKHLDDPDTEVRRAAIWGVGYFGLKSELDRLRKFFEDEELRSDALFAYTLALPAEVSRGRMKSLLTRIEKDAKGLSEAEEDLVKAALDERLMLAGKEPVFLPQVD
ncbi:MAG: HEAT repeat domain-containing protein [Acidobacteriaceae bacterium]|nr:HEAT repeat domain-containing protein [Acidobacteriaceae bacterium]